MSPRASRNGYSSLHLDPSSSLKREGCKFIDFQPPSSGYTRHQSQSLWRPLNPGIMELNKSDLTSPTFIYFTSLPLEIRHLIYEQVIRPFQPSPGHIEILLCNEYESALDASFYSSYGLSRKPSSKAHPQRTYSLHVNPCLLTYQTWFKSIHDHAMTLDYYTLWALSCASYTIRQELGAIFWPQVDMMVMTCIKSDRQDKLLASFTAERPMEARDLKILSLDICHVKSVENDANLTSIFRNLAAHMELDHLRIVIGLDSYSILEILEGSQNVPWSEALRNIRCRRFCFSLSHVDCNDENCQGNYANIEDDLPELLKMSPHNESGTLYGFEMQLEKYVTPISVIK